MKNLPSRRARVTSEHHAEGYPGPTSLDSERFDPNSIPSGCRAIPLANGGFALVDEDDLCRVDEYNWYKAYNKTGKTWYARAAVNSSNGRTKALMHRFLFGLSPGDRITVDHKNHDGLDNRRSYNLRLATRPQNSANTRTMRKASSKYRGAHWHSRFKKWASVMVVSNNGIATRFHFGFYDTEGEAAYAYSVAAPLLKDPEFLILEAIPDSVLPSPDRQIYVKNRVLAKIKAKLSGGKTNLRATSKYHGPSWDRHNKQWRVFIRVGDLCHYLGMYPKEDEAAHAYDCAVEIYGVSSRRVNSVDLRNPDRSEEIRTEIAARAAAIKSGGKPNQKRSSRFWGVCLDKITGHWDSYTYADKKRLYLGRYSSEVEAAIAHDLADELLCVSKPRVNHIPSEDTPSAQITDAIRAKVSGKISLRNQSS